MYSANEKRGDTTQINGTMNPIHESQQRDLAPTHATPHNLDSATPAPVRCSNHDHHETGGENHRLSDPRVHGSMLRQVTFRVTSRWQNERLRRWL